MKIEVTKVEQPDISVRLGDRVVKLTESEAEQLCSELCRILGRSTYPPVQPYPVFVPQPYVERPYITNHVSSICW